MESAGLAVPLRLSRAGETRGLFKCEVEIFRERDFEDGVVAVTVDDRGKGEAPVVACSLLSVTVVTFRSGWEATNKPGRVYRRERKKQNVEKVVQIFTCISGAY